jgi:hypothetical protein
MSGGTWNDTEKKVRAGFYMRFIAAAAAALQSGPRGIVAIPVRANWGPPKQIVEITNLKELENQFHNEDNTEFTAYRCIRLALLGEPSKIIAYRLVDGTEANATITLKDTSSTPVDVLRLDTKYPSTRSFNVTVRANAEDATKKDIVLFEGTEKLYTFTFDDGAIDNAVNAINNDENNVWLEAVKLADGNGTLANVSNSDLAGGNAGVAGITNTHYTDALSAFETRIFNSFALDGATDGALQSSVKSWTDRLINEGKYILSYLGGSAANDQDQAVGNDRSTGFDFEGVINVTVSGILDGVTYPSAEVACYVAGLASGQSLKESTTYAATPFDDVTPRLTHNQIVQGIKAGSFLLVHDGEKVICEKGINTLTTPGTEQNDTWKKIKSIRIMHAIASDTSETANDAYIGKLLNNSDGQAALLSALKNYFEGLAPDLIAEDFTVEPDAERNATATADQFYWKWSAQIIDSMEQIYGTGIIR